MSELGVPVSGAASRLPSPRPPRAPSVDRPEVSLLALVHDTPREAEALLDSIVRNTHDPYEILLIDNGSSPAGRDAHASLAETYGARLIALDANVTFSIANNLGVRISSGDEVVFLNSDVEVTPNWLRNLRAALHSAPEIGIVGPRTNFSTPLQSGIWLDDSSPAGVQEFGRFFNNHDPLRWFEVEWLAGFTVLCRRAALDAVSGFDETIPWHGLEDKALGDALRGAGWRVVCAGDTFVYHAGHRTFDQTNVNRTATRFRRPAAPAASRGDHVGRLLEDQHGMVFEVREGVAHHLEAPTGLVQPGRPIEAAAPGELERFPVGPPITLGRARGTDEVWVLDGYQRRPVCGDPERIRRLPWVSIIEPDALADIPHGSPVRVEDTVPAVPNIRAWLASNPAEIVPDRLVGAEVVAEEIRAAIAAAEGYAMIQLGRDEVLVLNQGMWPAEALDQVRAGVREDPRGAARGLRQAIIGADAVGVTDDRSEFAGAPLLEQLLFHYDLYPRLRCSSQVSFGLMGIDPATGKSDDRPLLIELLEGKRVAVVCPRASATRNLDRTSRRRQGLDVRIAVGLDDMRELDSAFATLAAQRGAFDAVLAVAAVAAKPLCTRLARELHVVALDLGSMLHAIVRPRALHNPALDALPDAPHRPRS